MAKKGFSKNSQSYTGYDNEMVACLSALGKVKVAKQEEKMCIRDRYNIGNVYVKSEKIDQAIEAYSEVIRQDK